VADIPSRIARVELRCSNPEASAAFYSQLTGLEVGSLDTERAELRAAGAEEPLLVLRRAARPGPAPAQAAGLFHTAFRFPDRPALGAALRRLGDEMLFPLTGASDHGVSEALYLDDPDGLGIELYRDRPVSEWPQTAGGERVRMFTEPLDLGGVHAAGEAAAGRPTGEGVDIGHVHLKVSDPDRAAGFWTERVGMDLMTRFGPDAVFLGMGGYHHHVGANSWFSRGASSAPEELPGIAAVAIAGEPQDGRRFLTTPDGLSVQLEPRGE
jgi:catechol 2,3-dioxygenase